MYNICNIYAQLIQNKRNCLPNLSTPPYSVEKLKQGVRVKLECDLIKMYNL